MTDFRDMKLGPARRLAERELRILANNLEELAAERGYGTYLIKDLLDEAMEARGLSPKDQPEDYAADTVIDFP